MEKIARVPWGRHGSHTDSEALGYAPKVKQEAPSGAAQLIETLSPRIADRDSPLKLFSAICALLLQSSHAPESGRLCSLCTNSVDPDFGIRDCSTGKRMLCRSPPSRAMAGRSGTAVVLDVHSGQVLASYHLDVAARRVVHPGSSIKPFTLMALLELGKVNEQTALMCKRSLWIGGHKLDCTHPATAQPLDPAAALAYSCNSYFSTVALRLTPAQLHDNFARDGFASVTSLAPDEAAGNVALAQSPEQLQLEAIGEWGISVTPLEMVRAYRQIALLAAEARCQARSAVCRPGAVGRLRHGTRGAAAFRDEGRRQDGHRARRRRPVDSCLVCRLRSGGES